MHHNGVRLRDRVAQITYREDPGFRYIFQKAGFLPREFISIKTNHPENQIDQLAAFNPSVIYGYPSNLVLLAREVKERGNCQIRPKHIFTTGELLNSDDRELINRAFKVDLRDIYGIVEMGDVAWQCSELRSYHLNVDSFLVEVRNDGRPTKPGEVGHLTITNLHSRAMPFIRYEVGDMLTAYREDRCPCGCTFPLVDMIQGREDDWLYLPDGKRFSPMAFEVSAVPGIKQYRVIQKDYNHLFVEIIPGFDFVNRTPENVRKHVQKIVGPALRVQVSEVDHIPQQSGKMRRYFSELVQPVSLQINP
jgi:phenylacetate-CoA ligase